MLASMLLHTARPRGKCEYRSRMVRPEPPKSAYEGPTFGLALDAHPSRSDPEHITQKGLSLLLLGNPRPLLPLPGGLTQARSLANHNTINVQAPSKTGHRVSFSIFVCLWSLSFFSL